MEISSQSNNYQMLNTQQQVKQNPVTLPVEPQDPKYSSSEIYEASNGNAVSDRQGNVSITPQGAESMLLGKRFSITRNIVSFIFSIVVALITIFWVGLL